MLTLAMYSSIFRFEEFNPFSYSVEPVFSNERVITIEGSLESISAAEKDISRKLRQCMEKDMRTLMSVSNFFIFISFTYYSDKNYLIPGRCK